MKIGLVELGRNGDILNILPLARHLHEHGHEVHLLVVARYRALLDGVSYVVPTVVPVADEGCTEEARQWAGRQGYDQVLVSKVYNNALCDRTLCENFAEEAYRLAGHRELFGKLPLVIDRRDRDREAALCTAYKLPEGPFALLNLHGFSSPCTFAPEIKGWLSRQSLPLVWAESVVAERFYDLLGVIERAAVLVTVDTATLWLARATATPTIELVSGRPWLSSPAGPNCAWRTSYPQIMSQLPVLRQVLLKQLTAPAPAPKCRLFLSYFRDPDDRRHQEIVTALRNNVMNPHIDEIVMFRPRRGELPNIEHKKLRLVSESDLPPPMHPSKRPTFQQFMAVINFYNPAPQDISIIANNDIYFDGSIAHLFGLPPDQAYCLCRWDVQADGHSRPFDRLESQDVWAFRGPVRKVQNINFPMGFPGCDNRFAWELREAGYVPSNPCRTIHTHHLHLSGVRRYPPSIRIPRPYLLMPPYQLGDPVPEYRYLYP